MQKISAFEHSLYLTSSEQRTPEQPDEGGTIPISNQFLASVCANTIKSSISRFVYPPILLKNFIPFLSSGK